MTSAELARIVDAVIVAGHDARAEVEVRIRYPGGGESQIRLDQEAAQYVLDQAGIESLDELRGRSWDILKPALGAQSASAVKNQGDSHA